MKDTILTIYCLCDDVLKALEHQDDPQARVSSAQVMTVPLVAARFFGGKVELARVFLQEHGYITQPLSKSRLNRRLHALPLVLWEVLFEVLGQTFKALNLTQQYTVDSMPIPVCDNIRISRCRLFAGECPRDKKQHRGYCASKRRYFYGLKAHLLITGGGAPVEFVLTPASVADISGLRRLTLELPAGAKIYGDRAYTDYKEEDLLHQAGGLTLQAQRKANSKRRIAPWLEALARPVRQRIETTFSQVEAMLPRHIHAVTEQGFILKVFCFLLAVSFRYLEG
jgi:hypothetical protein